MFRVILCLEDRESGHCMFKLKKIVYLYLKNFFYSVLLNTNNFETRFYWILIILNRSIWLRAGTLTGTNITGQSKPRSNGNEWSTLQNKSLVLRCSLVSFSGAMDDRARWRERERERERNLMIYIYIYIYISTHTHIYIYTHTHTHIYIYIYMCVCQQVQGRVLHHFSAGDRVSVF